jgi:N-acetylglucosaminyldiphosphoundecaprenol N-acetyl-beta-D-mannosaminyltransferase
MSIPRKTEFLGVRIGEGSLQDATRRAIEAIDRRSPPFVFSCAMAHSLNVAQSDPDFLAALRESDMVVADGVGVWGMARIVGIDVGARMAGEQVYQSVLAALQVRGQGRVFYFGSSDKVLGKIAARFTRDYPALELAGTLAPPYRPWSEEEDRGMVTAINASRPDVLWVGLGAPKQEKWVRRNLSRLEVPFIGSVGAVFDYYAGTNPAPPRWVRRFGLETPYRLVLEPRRLWRRAIVSNVRFVLQALRQHVF